MPNPTTDARALSAAEAIGYVVRHGDADALAAFIAQATTTITKAYAPQTAALAQAFGALGSACCVIDKSGPVYEACLAARITIAALQDRP